MLKLYDSIIRKRITKKYIFNILKNLNNRSVQDVFLIRMGAPALQSILCLLTISVILPAAASSSLSLSVPPVIDVSDEGAYEIVFTSSVDASSLSARLLIPDGFSYSRGASIELAGRQSKCEPSLNGQSIVWDLTETLKSFRHVLINEFKPIFTSNISLQTATRATQPSKAISLPIAITYCISTHH